jgi:signal transduction histidine kinase
MRFRDQPIARKALTLGLAPTLCALLIVTGTFGVAVFVTLRASLVRDSEALVSIVADNVSAAVGFNDPRTASELLHSLRAKESIDRVCVFDANGKLFASYTSVGQSCGSTDLGTVPPDSHASVFTRPVAVGDRRVGSVQLVSNTRTLRSRMEALAVVAGATLLLVALVAWALADRMQRSISGPIMALVDIADRVSSTRDYSLRADRMTTDEIGRLVTAFNGMLTQVERQNRVKDEFLATLSHELRTPLNAVLGWLHILQTTTPDEKTLNRGLGVLERNARAQQRVVEDLLDISRIVTGKLQMSSDVVDLRSVVTGAIEVVAESAAKKGLTLHTSLLPSPCLVSGDAVRLQQAVWNLLSNSVKFTPEGGTVNVTLASAEAVYRIIVQDSGMGIEPAFLPRVFDRFQQADSSTTREHSGLGLGLALVKEIAALHGGTVVASSAGKGLGTTFTLALPRLVASELPAPDVVAVTQTAAPSRAGHIS